MGLLTYAACAAGEREPQPNEPDPFEQASADAGSRFWEVTPDVRVSELTEGVWMHTTWSTLDNGSRFLSNGLIARDQDGTLTLIDTAWGVEPTRALLDWMERQLGGLPARAIVTHFHDDSMGGTPVLAERGVEIVGSAVTLEVGRESGIPLPRPIPGLARGEGVTVGSVEVFDPGPGHSPDNLVVWLPDHRVLYGGCAVRPGESAGPGNTSDADLEHWPQAMRNIQNRYPDISVVVPSHGAPGGPELLEHTIRVVRPAS